MERARVNSHYTDDIDSTGDLKSLQSSLPIFLLNFLLNWFRYLRPNDELVPNRARRSHYFGAEVQDFSTSIDRIYKAELYSSLQVEPTRYLTRS